MPNDNMLTISRALLQDLFDDVSDYACSREFKAKEKAWRDDLLARVRSILTAYPGTPEMLAAHPGQPEPIAWESTTVAYTKYITDERYQNFSPEVRKWYKPYRCSACSEPRAEVTGDDKVCAERYRWLRARMAFVEGPNATASMSMRSSIPAPNHDFNADFVGDRFDASVDAAIDGAIAAARAHGQDSGSLAESKSAVKAPRCY
ncbi:hypothetical protein [Burkholderia multivorans]|uniref:hypothetical protein n=1 Tax=Burkholderia multivorans TaxID=87883 RepID=UPI000A5527AB|nr:hypothetical protein [Burkholderia multivorans]MDN8102351.1 hypothetical protein [Burkholderia multivorans]